MPPVVPAVASTGPGPSVTIVLVSGGVLVVGCVVILLRRHRPKRLDDRTRARRGLRAAGFTAALEGSGAASSHGGNFDGGGGGGGPC